MFESTAATLNAERFPGDWADRAVSPEDPTYLAYLAYEEQQIAFWNAYSASVAAPDEVLNLNPARTDAGFLTEIARQARRLNAAEGAKLRAVADYANRRIADPQVGYDERLMRHSVEAEVVRSLYDAINDKTLAARAGLTGEHAQAGLVLPARDERPVGAQRHDTTVDLLAGVLGIDPWAPPVPVSSFLTEDQIADLDRNAATYRPGEAMKRAVRNRDRHCRFPGCRRPARFCDVDHTTPFVKVDGKLLGPGTVYFNLGCLCRFHHQVKQLPGWHLEQDRGRFTWTTPTGIRLVVHPPPDDDDAEPPDFARYDPSEDEIPY